MRVVGPGGGGRRRWEEVEREEEEEESDEDEESSSGSSSGSESSGSSEEEESEDEKTAVGALMRGRSMDITSTTMGSSSGSSGLSLPVRQPTYMYGRLQSPLSSSSGSGSFYQHHQHYL